MTETTKTTMSRVERKANKQKRISYFRNQMNKAWIGAKKSNAPRSVMKAKANILMRENRCEKDTVKEGINQWWEKNEAKVARLEKRLAK